MHVLEPTTEIDQVAQIIRDHRTRLQTMTYTDADARRTNSLHGWVLPDGRRVVLDDLEMTTAIAQARRLKGG